MDAHTQNIILRDGRTLSYDRYGATAGPCVIYAHGFPGSRIEGRIWDDAAQSAGVQLIAPDRPGFGKSSPASRPIIGWPDDVAELADALGFERIWLLGGSGGCPFTLACALSLGHRIERVALCAGLGPTCEAAALRKMSLMAQVGMQLARRAPCLFKVTYGGLGLAVARFPSLLYQLNKASQSGPDAEVLAQPFVRSVIDASVKEALRQGTAGAVHELTLLARPWGFDLGGISQPVDLWHGTQDTVVPETMAESMARELPNARLRLVPGEGHISLMFRHCSSILASLLSTETTSE